MIGGRHQLFASGDAWEHHDIKLGMSWNGSWLENFAQFPNENTFNIGENNPQFQLALNGDYQFETAKASTLTINMNVDSNWDRQHNSDTRSTTMMSGIEFQQ